MEIRSKYHQKYFFISAEGILNNSKEEINLIPIYRDPVHDFGFFKFNTAAVKFQQIKAIPLKPEEARIGIDVRVIGNDSGERLSILSGVLARMDRKAPHYGVGRYNDFNTFYYQAASMTSGGSSGSPVVNINGEAIALNAGSSTKSASSFFLPLDSVFRALKIIQAGGAGTVVPRGTIQTVFKYTPYDEVKRLGLDQESEKVFRTSFPLSTGMLVVQKVIPKGPADSLLEAGDILLKIKGEPLVTFVALETFLDGGIHETVEMDIQRGSETRKVSVTVQDLHSITPSIYVEVGGGIINTLSYQLAYSYMIPCGGVYVCAGGYMLGFGGVSRGSVITSINNVVISTLDEFIEVMKTLKQRDRVPVRYYSVGDINKEQLSLIEVDRRWHKFSKAHRK